MAASSEAAEPAVKERSDDGIIQASFVSGVISDVIDDIAGKARRSGPHAAFDRCATLSELLGLDYGDDGPPAGAPPLNDRSPVLYDRLVDDGAGVMVRVVQPRVAKQPSATGMCGFKALYNSLVANHYAHALAQGAHGDPGAPVAASCGVSPSALGRLPSPPQAADPPAAAPGPGQSEATERAATPSSSAAPASGAGGEPAVPSEGSSAVPPWHGEMRHHLSSRADYWRMYSSLKADIIEDAYRRWRKGDKPLWKRMDVWGDVLERPHIDLCMRAGNPVLEDLPTHMTVCLGERRGGRAAASGRGRKEETPSLPGLRAARGPTPSRSLPILLHPPHAEFGASNLRGGGVPRGGELFAAACRRFVASEYHHHTFLLGLASHWIAVTAVKYADTAAGPGAPPRFAVIVMDSENHRCVGMSATDLVRRIAGITSFDKPETLFVPLW